MSGTVISYSKSDATLVLKLRDFLARAGVRIWMDRTDIALGSNWQESIERAIKDCEVVLVVLSQASVKSREVEAEWSLGLRLGRRIVPVLLEPVEVPFRLANHQHTTISGEDLAVAAAHLAAVLPRRREPPVQLVTSSEAFKLQESTPGRYAQIVLWLEDDSLDMEARRSVLVDRQAFGSVKSLLDHLYLEYLAEHVSPYSYGAEWLLCGPWLVVPFAWLRSPGTRLQDVDLSWISETPLSEVFFEAGWQGWVIVSGKGMREIIHKGVYGVMASTDRMISALSYHPKSSHYLLNCKELFDCFPVAEAPAKSYRFSLVSSAYGFKELASNAYFETKHAAKNPKLLDKHWRICSRLE